MTGIIRTRSPETSEYRQIDAYGMFTTIYLFIHLFISKCYASGSFVEQHALESHSGDSEGSQCHVNVLNPLVVPREPSGETALARQH